MNRQTEIMGIRVIESNALPPGCIAALVPSNPMETVFLMDTPSLTLEQAQAVVASKTAPKITKESIEARIASTSYSIIDHMTVCVLQMVNGFMVTGTAAPASPDNFDPEVGKRYAYEDAFKQLWKLEGHLLREKLWEESKPKVDATPAPGP